MTTIAETQIIKTENYTLTVYMDSFNKRVRVDDLLGNISEAVTKAEEIANAAKAEKLIVKGRQEQYSILLEHGFQCEAVIDDYFLGSHLYFFCKYYSNERRTSIHWIDEDDIIKNVQQLQKNKAVSKPPAAYKLKRITHGNAEAMADLYREVFQIYPTPLHDPEYIKQTIDEGTIYYGFEFAGKIVSAASAEVNLIYKNAELTDCATLPEHRKYGLMKIILETLEGELRQQGIYCAYSIARSLSFGMNAVLHQLGYAYRGRLTNNCFIFDKLENMNIWVRNLSDKQS